MATWTPSPIQGATPVIMGNVGNVGNVLTRKDPRGNIRTYERDDLGRLERIIDPLNHVARMDYDLKGRIIRIVSPYVFDSLFVILI